MNTKKKSSGCLWIILVGFISILGLILVNLVFDLSVSFTAFFAVVLGVFFTAKILDKPSFLNIVLRAIPVYIVVFLIQGFFYLINEEMKKQKRENNFTKEDVVVKTTVTKNKDTISLYTSNRNWKDNYGNAYQGALSVREADYEKLKAYLDSFSPKVKENFWGVLYDYIDRKDIKSLDLVIDMFSKLQKENKLNQMQFAEMLVTCIQDIPYSLVFEKECLPANRYDDSYRRILENCPECCIGNKRFGIQNPVSFIKNLKGDCDTRTVLIYSLLKYFDYDVAIVNSTFYKHSVIGLNIPATGDYKMLNGKKYMLWETTAKYYTIGKLPPNFNNVSYWNIVLTSK